MKITKLEDFVTRYEELVLENQTLQRHLLEAQGRLPFRQGEELMPLIVAAREGRILRVVKELRLLTGLGLKDAKEAAEQAWAAASRDELDIQP